MDKWKNFTKSLAYTKRATSIVKDNE